ncbi:MAG: class I SAM-dependent methyltransferase [Ruminococcus sp.]|nr:class I SAM-dependent methyltransferase [Ruminococcus sp.]
MNLNNESQTLFIPLYGKAMMSKNNLFLKDTKAEEIIGSIDYDFSKLRQSKWLSMYMSARAMIIDEMCNDYIVNHSEAVIVHLGCGMDSRTLRVNQSYKKWYDVDFESVISLRRNYYSENKKYTMIGKSVTDLSWIDEIMPTSEVLIIAEGLTMYLTEDEIKNIVERLSNRFGKVKILFDAYSQKAIKASKYKNPVKQMNASVKWGMDEPEDFKKLSKNLVHIGTYSIKHSEENLKGFTKFIFEKIYCGKISENYYKIFEFDLG